MAEQPNPQPQVEEEVVVEQQQEAKRAPKLRYLDFVHVAAAQAAVCLAGLYGLAKGHAGPLRPGVDAVESAVKGVVGPVYDRFHGVPLDVLAFVDRKRVSPFLRGEALPAAWPAPAPISGAVSHRRPRRLRPAVSCTVVWMVLCRRLHIFPSLLRCMIAVGPHASGVRLTCAAAPTLGAYSGWACGGDFVLVRGSRGGAGNPPMSRVPSRQILAPGGDYDAGVDNEISKGALQWQVDDTVHELDKHLPGALKAASAQAYAVARGIPEVARELTAEAQQSGVAQIVVPTAAYWAEKYNKVIAAAANQGYTGAKYLPAIPTERIAKVFSSSTPESEPLAQIQ
ncbi:stress-related protein-like [Panicum miliaceum]|uniref:Stress-related protein-like n=1 Tax=Panicum miliaceum TaxID=4540 RepID=A0A3L6T9N6_PANMI|nr:stress-related protein-like [Panicum miliaceum]